MNKFYKVSLEQYLKDNENSNAEQWENIKIPKRATAHSAGYDFFSPIDFELNPGETIKIPSGIKVELDDDKFLSVVPRSSLGFKYRLQLDNTVGIIDADYYNNSNNEGHIFIKMTNDTNSDKVVKIKKGEAIAQGIILQYFLTNDDDATAIREGGIGSTDCSSCEIPKEKHYVLYSTHCPQCNVLYAKLKNKKISFEESEDFSKPIELGFMSAPILFDGEKYYTFSEAIQLLNTVE